MKKNQHVYVKGELIEFIKNYYERKVFEQPLPVSTSEFSKENIEALTLLVGASLATYEELLTHLPDKEEKVKKAAFESYKLLMVDALKEGLTGEIAEKESEFI